MSDKMNQKMDEAFLDAAVAEALQTQGPEESDAYVRELAQSDEESKRVARELKETVARLSAASPYMEPPASLRGKILQATAPASFKMEDYRKKGEGMSSAWLRWGMVAAVAFLTWSAYTNMSLQNTVKQQNQVLVSADGTLKQYQVQVKELQTQVKHASVAIAALADDKVQKSVMVNEKGEKLGLLVQDPTTKEFLIVMPQTVMPPNAVAKLVIEQKGVRREIQAVAIGAMGNKTGIHGKLPDSLNQADPVQVQIDREGVPSVRAATKQ